MPSDWNREMIEKFRAAKGDVHEGFQGRALLLLHTTGAKSGEERINPLTYMREGDAYVVFGSKGGAPTNPDWYHNLIANPEVTMELGTETFRGRARVTTGEEHDELWRRQIEDIPAFGGYEEKAGRTIPVIVIERIKD